MAQEREEAKAKKEKSTIGNTNFLEKMGVVDFHVKAVPGTEVPGHKVSVHWQPQVAQTPSPETM